MYVLFSPIGNTDPWSNYRDGAMLHIVRHYRPDKVVLFFTKSIWEGNKHVPGRKAFNWDKIINNVSPNTKVEIKIDDVKFEHDFDAYKELFHSYIEEIKQEYPDASILLNVTSGTPQMESTLCLEYVTNPDQKQCIQVSTPEPSANIKREFATPIHQTEDLQKVNENENNASLRSKPIAIISFREAMIRSQLIGLIENYDYEAALYLMGEQVAFRNAKNIKKILLSLTRHIKTHEVFPEIKERYHNKALQKALMHYLLLDMRNERQDIAETLIRVKSIAEFIVCNYIERHYPDTIVEKEGKPYLNTEGNLAFILQYREFLKLQYKSYNDEKILSLPALIDILTVLDSKSYLLKELKAVNEINGLRNSVAHQLNALKLEKNRNYKKIKLSVEAIQNMLKASFPEIEENDFHYFEEKNKELIRLL